MTVVKNDDRRWFGKVVSVKTTTSSFQAGSFAMMYRYADLKIEVSYQDGAELDKTRLINVSGSDAVPNSLNCATGDIVAFCVKQGTQGQAMVADLEVMSPLDLVAYFRRLHLKPENFIGKVELTAANEIAVWVLDWEKPFEAVGPNLRTFRGMKYDWRFGLSAKATS